jgi:hypothetical protein
MSPESWQVKKYYPPRVLISVADLLDPPLPPMTLVCLSGAELLLLRNVLDYCHRRSSFVVTYGTTTYVSPDNETWDTIEGIVAELEGKLMADCSDILDRLDSIVTALEAVAPGLTGITDALGLITDGVLDLGDSAQDSASALACICTRLAALKDGPAVQAQIDEYLGDETLIVDDPYNQEETPGVDADACAIAQLTWYFMYETMTEVIGPAQDKTVSILLPLALAAIASWIGTPLLGIPVGAVMILLWDLIDTWVAGRFSVVENAIFNNKDEIICAAYKVLRESGNLDAAAEAVHDAVSDIPELSLLDRVCIASLGTSWVMSRMAVAWTNQTAWATQRVSAGYCATCPEDDIEGSDWWAQPITLDPCFVVDHPAGQRWDEYCEWNWTIPDGSTAVGLFFEVTEKTGNCNVRYGAGTGSPCNMTYTFTQDNSPDLAVGWYFLYADQKFDHAECLAAVHPGATAILNGVLETVGPKEVKTKIRIGWDCTGSYTLCARWMVWKGAKPE